MPLRRYRCTRPGCDWTGLGYSESQEAKRAVKTPVRMMLAVIVVCVSLLLFYLVIRFLAQ